MYRESDIKGHLAGEKTPYNAELTRFVQWTQSEKTTPADLKVPSSLKSISKVYMARPIRFGLINKYVKDGIRHIIPDYLDRIMLPSPFNERNLPAECRSNQMRDTKYRNCYHQNDDTDALGDLVHVVFSMAHTTCFLFLSTRGKKDPPSRSGQSISRSHPSASV